MSYLALKEQEQEQEMTLEEFQKKAPQLSEAEARQVAQQALLASMTLCPAHARVRFEKVGIWVKGKNEMLFRDRDRGGELTPLQPRGRVS